MKGIFIIDLTEEERKIADETSAIYVFLLDFIIKNIPKEKEPYLGGALGALFAVALCQLKDEHAREIALHHVENMVQQIRNGIIKNTSFELH